jgi:5-oxoprolinase (ATP-hydrolysing)
VLAELAASVLAELGDPTATVSTFLDCRYAGQSHELRVASVDGFPVEHEQRNGYRRQDGTPVEVVALRAVAEGAAPASVHDVLAGWADRWTAPVVGPCTVTREDCTIWVPEGWTGEPGPLGALVLRRTPVGPQGGAA